MSTSPVRLAQELDIKLGEHGIHFLDAPVTRTREAAVAGTLAVTVGARDEALFRSVEGLLRCMATDVTYCGRPGAGALVKLLNNLIVFETVVALAEATTIARRTGLIDETLLYDVLGTGSAGSFALENHGKKSMLPDTHPAGVFSARYMFKDLTYALDVADQTGVNAQLGDLARRLLAKTIDLGYGDRYHTAVIRAVEHDSAAPPLTGPA